MGPVSEVSINSFFSADYAKNNRLLTLYSIDTHFDTSTKESS